MSDEQEIEFDISFDDETMAQADGSFKKVKRLMATDPVPVSDWMVRTILTMDSVYGLAAFRIHCYSDGRVIVKDYQSSVGSTLYNPDMQALSEWAQTNGWLRPEPAESLVKSDLDFWKHYWSKFIVDSQYLEDMFGVRPEHDPSLPFEEDDE